MRFWKSWEKVSIALTAIPVLCVISAVLPAGAAPPAPEQLRTPAPGIEYSAYRIISSEKGSDENRIHVVRIDPAAARLKLLTASEHDGKLRTAREWCRDFNLVSAINAGMFAKDYSTNVGYLRNGDHVQNGRWNRQYRSALAFNPKRAGIPAAVVVDLDETDARRKLEDYASVIQNLRLMKADGVSVWQKSDRKWSEAAVGIDREGRVLFIFCRKPLPMWKFNEMLGSLGLGILRLMHMEGGSWASLSVRSREFKIDLAGDFESGEENGGANFSQMRIPNVIGVQAADVH